MISPEKLDPPSDDKRWRIVKATMRRNGFARHSLIETLHSVQESFGFLDEDSYKWRCVIHEVSFHLLHYSKHVLLSILNTHKWKSSLDLHK